MEWGNQLFGVKTDLWTTDYCGIFQILFALDNKNSIGIDKFKVLRKGQPAN